MRYSVRDQVYVEHMLECIERVERYAGKDRGLFMHSDLVQDAVVRNLQMLAESSQRLSLVVKASQSSIDWRAISGFRNVLVHDYMGLDLEAIWLVVEIELPKLKRALDQICENDVEP
jgi:uncharacterized protein with HEPN domain